MQQQLFKRPSGPVAGIDEAGRGPLAGPVVAAAVILNEDRPIDGLADSKKLSPNCRAELARAIEQGARAWAVAWADVCEIDRLNILFASLLAMRRAVLGLRMRPAALEVDGNRLPDLVFDGRAMEGTAIVGGDDCVPAISAASILAKVYRDRIMLAYDRIWPDYGFGRHKGYATPEHRRSILRHGPCRQHRMSFRPFRTPTGAG